jgi:hypothetical protein
MSYKYECPYRPLVRRLQLIEVLTSSVGRLEVCGRCLPEIYKSRTDYKRNRRLKMAEGDFNWISGIMLKFGLPIAIVVGIVMYVKSCITG